MESIEGNRQGRRRGSFRRVWKMTEAGDYRTCRMHRNAGYSILEMTLWEEWQKQRKA